MFKKWWIIIFIAMFSLFSCHFAPAKVINRRVARLYSAYFYVDRASSPTNIEYFMKDFGPGNIKFLKQIDIVVDDEGRLVGVQLIYTLPDGFRRKTFFRNVRGWTFKLAKRRGISKKVLIRVVTSDELNVPW